MKITTITTLELSSICNLECDWCVNRMLVKHPKRKAGIMSDAVFDQSVEIIKELVNRGTQRELNLNGNGESLLDPQIIKRIATLRKKLGDDVTLMFSTNGILLNPEICDELKGAGINRVDISPWMPGVVRKAIHDLAQAGISGVINWAALGQSHNWAGQLEPENRVPIEPSGCVCYPLLIGAGYIQSEGDVIPCCYDYRNLGRVGHVFDDTILERELKPFALCETCHQIIPRVIKFENVTHKNRNGGKEK